MVGTIGTTSMERTGHIEKKEKKKRLICSLTAWVTGFDMLVRNEES